MDNLRYHPGHTWAVGESPELARVGIDDFAARLVGKIEKVLLPNRGQWIRQGQKIVAIQHDGVAVEMISPVEGSVVDINEAVANDPELARRDPYGDGWLFTVNSPDMKTNFRNLLGGSMARRWMEEAAARLRQMVPAPVGVYAQDGGTAIDDVAAHLPKDEWEKVAKEFFLS
jgi:glycine cleavage system H lipoate-binding protein